MTDVTGIRPPRRVLQLMESSALFEIGGLVAASPMLRLLGRGDRHPVLVLPGFTASDRSTVPLRSTIRLQGYWAHGWGLGRNIGPSARIIDGMRDRLEQLHGRHGRKVSLVGWSLGGIYARQLAREQPDMVRQVITLGSPFRMVDGDRSAAQGIWDSLSHLHDGDLDLLEVAEHERGPLPVPATAIYTRTDGVVRWFTCIETPGRHRESIEVFGSHSGLGVNPSVVYAVLDRLSQREGSWQEFQPPWFLRHLYPHPATYRVGEDLAAA
ncbi:MAG: alpha/beta hydrolase [Actinomycetota bacterium]